MPSPKPLIGPEKPWQADVGKTRGGVGRAAKRHVKEAAYTTLNCIECVLCTRQRSRQDILSGLYRAETMICSYCYAKMQQQPYEASCFGKPGYAKTKYNPKRIYGYMPTAIECSQMCPDAAVCKLIVCGPAPNRKIPN
jgi:hypothetical protein